MQESARFFWGRLSWLVQRKAQQPMKIKIRLVRVQQLLRQHQRRLKRLQLQQLQQHQLHQLHRLMMQTQSSLHQHHQLLQHQQVLLQAQAQLHLQLQLLQQHQTLQRHQVQRLLRQQTMLQKQLQQVQIRRKKQLFQLDKVYQQAIQQQQKKQLKLLVNVATVVLSEIQTIQTSSQMMSKMPLQLQRQKNQALQQISKLQTWPAKFLGWTLAIQLAGQERRQHQKVTLLSRSERPTPRKSCLAMWSRSRLNP